MPKAVSPRVSILIPNFNNGRQSSTSGRDDLLGNLLQSLWDTLHNDSTPFEILAYDDGSTDDSLATLRTWAARQWPNGRPVLELIEAPHCGYLSRVANILCRRARGEFLARLDGDIVCLTPHWVSLLCAIFDQSPREVGIVGPKQLGPDGKVHAHGDFVLHPNGYIHVAQGMERHAAHSPLEVDHIMGCFHCCRKKIYEDVGGYDERFLRGQTEDLGLMARLRGWRALAVPNIEFIHFHTYRVERATEADSKDGILKTLRIFEAKWGFSRLSPDLDEVRRRYAGTPLLWCEQLFGPPTPKHSNPPLTLQSSLWTRYGQDPAARDEVNHRVSAVVGVLQQIKPPRMPAGAVLLGAGEGLEAHILAAQAGIGFLAFDERADHLELARQCTASHQYPSGGANLRFELLPDVRRLPLPDASADIVVIMNLMERHPNPVGLLREVHRILAPEGVLLITSRRPPPASDPSATWTLDNHGEHRYHWKQLMTQVQSIRGYEFLINTDRDPTHDIVVVARRNPGPVASMPEIAEMQALPAKNSLSMGPIMHDTPPLSRFEMKPSPGR